METRKLLYIFAAITLPGLVGDTTGPNISLPECSFQYGILGKVAELDLTEAQKTQIHAVLRKARPGLTPAD
jgi:hypothetical protein